MPNNKEERRKLACVICTLEDNEKTDCGKNPTVPMCKGELDLADRVIKYYEGWKSPLDCNKCIDESAQRVSKLMQSQGHSG